MTAHRARPAHGPAPGRRRERRWPARRSPYSPRPLSGRVVAALAGELDRLHTRRQQLAHDLEEVFSAHPLGPVLATLPGVGPRTGAKILAEVGDGTRCATGAQLAAYAGLAPVTRQSGSSVRGETQSRRGNHRLKNAMLLAAFASLRSPASKEFYDRKRAEGKRHNAVVICLARRRCDVILAMLKNASPYEPDRTASPSETPALAAWMTRTWGHPPWELPAYPAA